MNLRLVTTALFGTVVLIVILFQNFTNFNDLTKKEIEPEVKSEHATSNILSNPSFENNMTGWNHVFRPDTSSPTAVISNLNCNTGSCVTLTKNNAEWQGVVQLVNNLEPGNVYEISFWSKTTFSEKAFVNLYDLDWKNSNGQVTGKEYRKTVQGAGEWVFTKYFVKIPNTDDSGESTQNHRYYLYLYGHNASEVNYDDIALYISGSPPDIYLEVEETDDWSLGCTNFEDAFPLTDCATAYTNNTLDKLGGNYSLELSSDRNKKVALTKELRIKPNTSYKTSITLKIKDRTTFNYLDLNYPSSWTQNTQYRDPVDDTKGIWSGLYSFKINSQNILQPIWWKTPQIAASDVNWFTETYYFKTKPDDFKVDLELLLEGYEGKFLIDSLSIEEVDTAISDSHFTTLINQGYQNMRITNSTTNPMVIETTTAKFEFTSSKISITKDGGLLGEISSEADIFANLSQTGSNNIILENDFVKISIGADNVLLLRLQVDANLVISGNTGNYSVLEAGVLFNTDGSKGVLVSPLRTEYEVSSMPYSFNENNIIYTYLDSAFDLLGIKKWEILSDFTNPQFVIEYNLKAGEGLVAQAFPAKEFDTSLMCSQRPNTINLNRRENPEAAFDYNIQKFNERYNIAVLWPNDFIFSNNTQDPPSNYCLDAQNEPLPCSSSSVASTHPITFLGDIAGPYSVYDPANFNSIIQKLHAKGIKAVIYSAPEYYYTSNVDVFLSDMQNLLNTYGLDGIYLDGLYRHDILKSLELARKSREMLGEKIYIQHNSWTKSTAYSTDKYIVPFENVYADFVINGEGVKNSDISIWNINYCGKDVSNTVSYTLPELRPVDYSQDSNSNTNLSLTPVEQIDKSLQCSGLVKLGNPYSTSSQFVDKQQNTAIDFDDNYYYDRLDSICNPVTCGNGICDIGESFLSCKNDCTLETNNLTRSGNTFSCPTENSVAQWTSDNEPFYKLHFTFDEDLVTDVSGLKHNLSHLIGVDFNETSPAEDSGRSVHYFDSSTSLFGEKDTKLDLTNKDFSSFTTFKRLNSSNNQFELLFSYGDRAHFYYGILNSRAYLVTRNSLDNTVSLNGTAALDDDEWHSIGVVYDGTILKLFTDGIKESEIEVDLLDFDTNSPYRIGGNTNSQFFSGYIDDLVLTDVAVTDSMALLYNNTLWKSVELNSSQVACYSIENSGYLASSFELQGDGTGDWKVDGLDYLIWLNHYNQNVTNESADGDYDSNGFVDGLDYVVWLNNYGL